MRTIAIATAALVMTLPALADEPYAPGLWRCETATTGAVCVDPQSLRRHGVAAEGHAVIHYRGRNHLGTLVRDCMSTKATTRGVPDLAENMPIDVGLQWMCDR